MRVAVVTILTFGVAAAAAAQAVEPPVAQARRVPAPPRIDGRLDDPQWQSAAPIAGFRQREPKAGAEVSEPTTVRVIYDQSHLYIGADLRDRVPSEIRASELRRDNTLESDDTFSVLLDSYHDHRNGFVFRVNARGTRFDALIRNESRFYYAEWDEQWTAAAAITETGWTVEIAIPFKILRFTNAPQQTWGLNFERIVKRTNELAYWAGWGRDYTFHNVSQAGHLSGLSDIRQAERLRIRPYIVAGAQNLDAVTDPKGTNVIRGVGIDDLKVAATSTLTADLAVNPDFAQTEVDSQQINLTRFSLFFPEKRQFFIEGAESLRMGVGLLHFGPPPLELFYSRNIGLSADFTPISVIAGGKLTGKVSGFDIGVLNAQTGDQEAIDGENFTVARVRKEVLGRSYVGAILTNRQGNGLRNTIAGADARFTFFKNLNVMGLVARSDDRTRPNAQWASQVGAQWQGDLVEAGANYIDVDPQFNPGIGFVRFHERLIGVRGNLKPRPHRWRVRQFELNPQSIWYHDEHRAVRSRESQFIWATNFESGDRIELFYRNAFERVVRRFPVGPVLIPLGVYDWNVGGATVRFYNGRAISGTASFNTGTFYDGDKQTFALIGDLRPTKQLSFNPTYELNDITFPQRAFATHLFGLRANVSFSTNLLTSAYVQYNSAGQLAATQVRFNYIFRTIDNVYVVFNETRYTGGVFDGRANRSLVMKVTYSVHR